MRRAGSDARAHYGLVAAYSRVWHAVPEFDRVVKAPSLRGTPIAAKDVRVSLSHVVPGMAIDFKAFYRTTEERALLEEVLRELELKLDLPESTTDPILRMGPGSYSDGVFLVERNAAWIARMAQRHDGGFVDHKTPMPPKFLFTGFLVPQ